MRVETLLDAVEAIQGVPLRQQQSAQFLLGKAASRIEAARETLFRAADAAYTEVESSGKGLSVESKVRVQLAGVIRGRSVCRSCAVHQ
jgi:alkylation response protein AidB-like acyl-CoA dehydrogenase